MWSTQKALSDVINDVIASKKFEQFASLQETLNSNFNIFLDVLSDKTPQAQDRDRVKKSKDEPIQINYLKQRKTLPASLIEEALTLSDLFNLNEVNSVELLLEAEERMQYFHGFNRGLTAILLYYDSKKIAINNLKMLLLARPGRTWILDENMPSEISNFFYEFVDKLLRNGLIKNILNKALIYDWPKVQENLLRVNGLGSLKHRKQVKLLFDEIKLTLSECVFNLTCQIPLSHTDTLLIINFLKNNCQVQTASNGRSINLIDTSHLHLIMSVLQCFDCNYLDNKQDLDLPKVTSYLSDEYIKVLYAELNKSDQAEWLTGGIKSLFQFSFQIFINMLNGYLNESDISSSIKLNLQNLSALDEEDILVEKAIDQKVFNFLRKNIIQNDKFHKEKYFVERIHCLITDFIYKMPEKIKDMRNKNEEIVKFVDTESFNQSSIAANSYLQAYQQQQYQQTKSNVTHEITNNNFEDFLNLIGEIYMKDPLKLELNLNYWVADSELNAGSTGSYQKPTLKQISLYKFVRYFLSGDSLISCLYIAYINMLSGLCTGEESAQHCFVLLQNNAHFYETQSTKISWDHIFYALERYHESFKRINDLSQAAASFGNQQYRGVGSVAVQQYSMSANKGITQQDLQGLIAVIRLVNQIAMNSEKARIALCEYSTSSNPNVDPSLLTTFNQTSMLNNLDASGSSLPSLMFGLLSCSIPITLKGEILNLLASLSLTPSIGANMWQLLENSQILPTITLQPSNAYQTPATTSRCDIKIELEEVESREETYPLLKGFLRLIKTLIEVSNIPENLGLGIRNKNSMLGFHPYLQFLINNVYLKIFYRSYKNLNEKWEITNEILDIFYLIILKYDISKEDFTAYIQQQKIDLIQISSFKTPVSNSPGHKLINDLIHDGPTIRMLFYIINESLGNLLEYKNENDWLIEKSSLMCLKIVSLVIEKQKSFMDQMKQIANLNVDNCGLEKLIIAINPTTNKADYLMWILRFIQFNSSLIHHSHFALNILYMLSNYSTFNTQLLNLFMKSCLSLNEQCELMNSFVDFLEYSGDSNECCEMLDDEYIDGIDLNDSDESTSTSLNGTSVVHSLYSMASTSSIKTEEMRSANRLKSIKFLVYYLRLPAPNIAHLLLGFDIHKPLKNQTFFNPGTKINYQPNQTMPNGQNESEILSIVPRTCLHSIISILNRYIKDENNLTSNSRMKNTIDCCYELLYMLCSNFQFNQQLLTYLRNEFDFINNNLKKIPFLSASQGQTSISFFSHYTWIINLVCIEMQNLITNRMKVHLKKLIQLLIEVAPMSTAANSTANVSSRIFSNSNFDNLTYNLGNNSTYLANKFKLEYSSDHQQDRTLIDDFVDNNNKIFSLLSILSFVQPTPEPLNLNYFDAQLIEKVIESCKHSTDMLGYNFNVNIQLYDLKKIKQIILKEIKASASSINISRVNLLNDLKYILQNVQMRNNFQLNFAIKKKYLEAFKTLVESLVLVTPCDVFNLNQRFKFLTSLIKRMFQPISMHENLVVELTYPIASILFTLVYNLRLVISQIQKMSGCGGQENQYRNVTLSLTPLTEIFTKLIDYLLNTSLTNYKVRTHLYATILNYLTIFDDTSLMDTENQSFNQSLFNTTASFMASGKDSTGKQVEKIENLKILSSNSNGLLKLICSDSCDGLNITTMLGLSLLNKIMEIDVTQKWIRFISDKGYISCIINAIQHTDNQMLEECFHSQARNDKIIYITETKLAFLMSLSRTNLGSQLLLKNGLVNSLIGCTIFALRSKFDRNIYGNRNSMYLVQLLHQYYQILFPTLDLCISIINSIGSDNIEVKSQIAKFILTYSDSFLHILTSRISDLKMLEELKLVTTLICKLGSFDSLNFDNISSNVNVEYKPIFSRIHKELLNLICMFLVPDQLKQIKKEIEHHYHQLNDGSSNGKENVTKLISSYFADIASNICSYCSIIMKFSQFNLPQLIFSPKLENHQLHPYSPSSSRLGSKHFKLGLLVDFLNYSLDNLERSFELEIDLVKKEENINDLILLEKKQIIGSFEQFDKMSENEKQFYLRNELKSQVKSTKHNTQNYISIIEKCLYLLWKHIEFYLEYFETNSDGYQIYKNDVQSGRIAEQNEYQSFKMANEDNLLKKTQLSKDDFVKFRQDLIYTLNINFLKKFSVVDKVIDAKEGLNNNFINILLKRIQKLIHLHTSNQNHQQ